MFYFAIPEVPYLIAVPHHRFTYVDKSTGRSYAWNDTEGKEGYYCIGSDYKRVEFVKSSL